MAALIDEAVFHEDDAFVGSISVIDGLHAKVMWAFLEKRRFWQGATLFLHADNVSSSYWKKRNDFPPVPPDVEDGAIQALANSISAFFHKTEGRGRNCKVEPYRRHNKEYFFAYPEDFSNSHYDCDLQDFRFWRSNNPTFRRIRPAFQHKIEQVLPTIKAEISRQCLHIVEQTSARRQLLKYTSPGHGCGFLAADFMPIAALLKQFHSLLCACFSALLSTKINSLSFPQP